MKTALALLVPLALLAAPAAAQEIKPRIGPKSEEVIRHELRQSGLQVGKVELRGETAVVDVTVAGKQAVLEMNRTDGRTAVLRGDHAARAQIIRQLRRQITTGPVAPER